MPRAVLGSGADRVMNEPLNEMFADEVNDERSDNNTGCLQHAVADQPDKAVIM